jgi:hypothetical protein
VTGLQAHHSKAFMLSRCGQEIQSNPPSCGLPVGIYTFNGKGSSQTFRKNLASILP